MTPRLRWLLIIAAVLAVCCAVVLSSSENTRPLPPPRPSVAQLAAKRLPPPSKEIVLVAKLPPKGAPLCAIDHKGTPDCAKTQVSELLGLEFAVAVGLKIGRVIPKGPAAEAGLAAGDSIVRCDGHEVESPQALLLRLEQKEKPNPIELTVRRPLAAVEDAGGRAKEATHSAVGQPAGSTR